MALACARRRFRAAGAATPGVTPTQIVLGATGPLTGSESAYAPVLTGAKAYFDYVNAHGGVNGRKIVYKVEDDQYDPVETVQLTQKLVEQDNVFAIFNSIGTEHALAVRDYLNTAQGAAALRRQRRGGDRHAAREVPVDDRAAAELHRRRRDLRPPDREGPPEGEDRRPLRERRVRARAARRAEARARRAGEQIVATQSYALLDTSVVSQVTALKASGADTFVIFALPTAGDPGVRRRVEARLEAGGVRHVGVDRPGRDADRPSERRPAVSASARPRRRSCTTRRIRRRSSAAGVKLYLQIMKRYLPSEDPKAVAHIYGMMAAYAMVDALKRAGKNPTRASLLHAAQHLNETNPFLLPGLKLTTTPTDYFPIGRTYLVRYLHGFWNVLGKPLTDFVIRTERNSTHDTRRFRTVLVAAAAVATLAFANAALAANTALVLRLAHTDGAGRLDSRRRFTSASRRRPTRSRPSTSSSRPATAPRSARRPARTIGTVDATALSHDGGLTLPLSGTRHDRRPGEAHGRTRCSAPASRRASGLDHEPLASRARRSSMPIYVNPTAGPATALGGYRLKICLPPRDVPVGTPGRSFQGAQLLDAKFTINKIFTTPTGAGLLKWETLFTPYNPGKGTPNLAGTFEARAFVPIPILLGLHASYVKKTNTWKLTGKATEGGLPVAGARAQDRARHVGDEARGQVVGEDGRDRRLVGRRATDAEEDDLLPGQRHRSASATTRRRAAKPADARSPRPAASSATLSPWTAKSVVVKLKR